MEVTSTLGELSRTSIELDQPGVEVIGACCNLLCSIVELTDLLIGSADLVHHSVDSVGQFVLKALRLILGIGCALVRGVEVLTEAVGILGELLHVRIVRIVLLQLFDPVVHVPAHGGAGIVEVPFGAFEFGSRPVDDVIGLAFDVLGLLRGLVGGIAQF